MRRSRWRTAPLGIACALLAACGEPDRPLQDVETQHLHQALLQRSDEHAAAAEGRTAGSEPTHRQDLPEKLRNADFAGLLQELRRRQLAALGHEAGARRDIREVRDEHVLANAASTVAIINGYKLGAQPDGSYRLEFSKTVGEKNNVCDSEPLSRELAASDCSGFLLDERTVVTAGHCILSDAHASKVYFVFGYRNGSDGRPPERFGRDDVYSASPRSVRRCNDHEEFDWAFITLDRDVRGHPPVSSVRSSGRIEKGTPVYALGHPAGAPLVYSGSAEVRDDSPDGYFVANLDVLGGSSGSIVVNARTHEVEGILKGTESIYLTTPEGCRVPGVCNDLGCRGVRITRMTVPVEATSAPWCPRTPDVDGNDCCPPSQAPGAG